MLLAGCAQRDTPDPVWRPGGGGGASGSPVPTTGATGKDEAVTLSATGDIVMGMAPSRLPANGGKGFFDAVKGALKADLVMGNLEEPLTADTGTGKCGANASSCYQFRAPPEYAGHLKDAGFQLLNQANNHGYDFGPQGYENTQQALEKHGLKHTGAPDQITVVEVERGQGRGGRLLVVRLVQQPGRHRRRQGGRREGRHHGRPGRGAGAHGWRGRRTRPGSGRAPRCSSARTGAIR